VPDSKLTVRVPHNLVEGAKRYARQNHTTVTRLVSEYLRRLTNQSDPLDDAPIVKRLSGILTENVSVEDYKKYIDEKYGNQD
jgi:hypothetical protein